MSKVSLPTVTFQPTGDIERDADGVVLDWPQVISDEDGNSYLILPCRHMEVSLNLGEGKTELELLVKRLQERIDEITENE